MLFNLGLKGYLFVHLAHFLFTKKTGSRLITYTAHVRWSLRFYIGLLLKYSKIFIWVIYEGFPLFTNKTSNLAVVKKQHCNKQT